MRRADALLIGLLSIAGVAGGVALANTLSGAVLRERSPLLLLVIAAQLVRRSAAPSTEKMIRTPCEGVDLW